MENKAQTLEVTKTHWLDGITLIFHQVFDETSPCKLTHL